MSLVPRSVREAIHPVHSAGWPFIAATIVLAIALGILWQPLFWILLVVAGWMLVFFRDPTRVSPIAPGLVISPADGRVEPPVAVVPPLELGLGPEPRQRISVFMDIFDCHINRAPVAARITRVAYKPGKFVSADLDKASEDNERNGFVMETPEGHTLGVVQVAGLVARRILVWKREGAAVAQGERIGMIRFGSRLDVYLPSGSTVLVAAGQRAIAGETVLAHLPGAAPLPPYPTRVD
ncbi:phosphatidylserine decarboxylase [Propylenella binzhouense]|uniref:Phosphatidylserine decarboxylase proenzyme n=1 Tax=Propylenella binzhouense TaxID=2555902 RepID=A0A964T330_9HYPH|nr:phosphatidylserine decarboxylase [Propylenella binzhouense]MYZ47475.1 phosphatidylserine decarboxylase [Propylenella binzhouense]